MRIALINEGTYPCRRTSRGSAQSCAAGRRAGRDGRSKPASKAGRHPRVVLPAGRPLAEATAARAALEVLFAGWYGLLNHALILRLASEFQGFAREPHDDSSNAVVTTLARGSTALRNSLISPYLSGRRLDRGNADPDALDHDYRMLGLDLWRELDHRYPHRCTKWRQHLRLLNTARNGLAHDDEQRIQQVITSGWLLTLPFIHRWRIALDGLATGMDHVTEQYIHHTLGVQPW